MNGAIAISDYLFWSSEMPSSETHHAYSIYRAQAAFCGTSSCHRSDGDLSREEVSSPTRVGMGKFAFE